MILIIRNLPLIPEVKAMNRGASTVGPFATTIGQLPEGIYQSSRNSDIPLITHWGTTVKGDRLLGKLGYAGWGALTFHRTNVGVEVEPTGASGAWNFIGKVASVEEENALMRLYSDAVNFPQYDPVQNNCEHFAMVTATGVKQSTQATIAVLAVLGLGLYLLTRTN
jgi:hypothetical protein